MLGDFVHLQNLFFSCIYSKLKLRVYIYSREPVNRLSISDNVQKVI